MLTQGDCLQFLISEGVTTMLTQGATKMAT